MEDISFEGVYGVKPKTELILEDSGPVVIAMTSTSCPLSKKYLPTLSNLAELVFAARRSWVLVNPIATDKPDDIQTAAKTVAGNAIYVTDREGDVAKAVWGTERPRTSSCSMRREPSSFTGPSTTSMASAMRLDAPNVIVFGRRPRGVSRQ